ncbi:hypothetical protein KIP31_10170 [Xanthomonas campestris pv. campestris]|jgi:hypothetical protein|uniref:hypothetical protein n=1 Tax=Xanthomonas campestris TaxID=339 RepID=UPI000E311BE3|nr:hypothetical protein [Xanthomonas campestris]MCF8799263.1 hypothetical protein [Xanthomonas campestris pv. campestris]MCF8809682.1 hypothetical protein [Xanthomonas campestris pv. campestris]MCF8813793.1 hypothetical protein [Xanthomonas campestris pv. campestris]MDM7674503.1 hypothetical protein [Xanthomonas campestris pv. campestris]MEA9569656.1 hypothetical protein [Xanthomonas campestris]
MLISENTTFGTQTRIVSPRIEIRWDPATNDGPVEFHLEQITTKPHPDGWTQTLERFFLRVLTVQISDLIGRSYDITAPATTEVDPVTGRAVEVPGETVTEPGAHLLLGIKAATRAAYDANVVTPDPDADPLAQQISIIWNPINDTGTVTFQVEDRGAALGVLAAPIADLIAPTYAIRYPGAEATQALEGWKLQALIKAATDVAIADSLASAARAAA